MEFIYTDPIGLTDLAVLEIGTQSCLPDISFGPSVRDMYILHYIHSGYGTYSTGGRTERLGPGDLFLVTPDTVHTYRADSVEPWSYSWFGFVGTFAPRLVEIAGFNVLSPVRTADSSLPVDSLFGNLMSLRKEPAKELLLTALLYQIFGTLAIPDDTPPLRADVGHHVRNAVSYMNARYADRISLHEIAEHVGLDTKYLCRLFQQRLSMSPYRYLTDVRMRKACRLLRRQLLGIAEIAQSVGYQDPLMFSRMFKRTIGISPTAYREKAKLESGTTSYETS
ncbi:AraC family ligand binding domain-containing protein [Paenibacillus qinlingensis]|uniref:AraC-like DNA-binding protein n=1 Tax=Paenibacillus qinlingensis TaxID=1837343 RepID=A0ABU1P1Y1_9BACL|nr:AraC family ligand binding domain-containing protein [Paenibacillus qinlingensis]MDR6553753.1 AraC-like DNA-binding protein [Paenibacillus qinlingensis]